jgi:hypothetical protein
MANVIADIQRTEYLQHAANNIDENSVKLMGPMILPQGGNCIQKIVLPATATKDREV